MYRGHPHADTQYNEDMDAARAAYTASGGTDNQQTIQEYRDARSRAMADAARRHAQQLKDKTR